MWRVCRKIQLVILFSIAGVVVFITILRLPLILNQAVSQRSRSMVRPPILSRDAHKRQDGWLTLSRSGRPSRFSAHASSPMPPFTTPC